jgi:hypothetical protein
MFGDPCLTGVLITNYLQELLVAHMVDNLPAFCETRKFTRYCVHKNRGTFTRPDESSRYPIHV